MKRSILVLGVAALAVAIFAGGAALYMRNAQSSAPVTSSLQDQTQMLRTAAVDPVAPPATPSVQSQTPAAEPVNPALVRDHSPVFGEANAPVTIVEFFDPACEACRAMYPHVKAIMAQHPGQVRLILRYTPFHSNSEDAVRILEAARVQGRLEPVLEALLEKQRGWAMDGAPNTPRAWQIAEEAGLDVEAARIQAAAPAVDALLQQDIADLQSMNIRGTPTFFVNGKPLQRFGPDELSALVAAEVAAAR